MRHRSLLAITAVVGLLLAGCTGGDQDTEAADQTAADEQSGDGEGDAEDLLGDAEAPGDPNEDVQDGVYQGNGVLLPVPDGWTIDPVAMQQGVVAAVSDDGTQQLTARALDTESAAAGGQEIPGFDELVDGLRQQLPQEAEVDESVDLEGAERAHRISVLDLPAQQEGGPESSVTILLATTGDGVLGEFAFSAPADSYDDATADLLLAEAGFDPDSEPPAPAPPQPQQQAPAPAPEGG